MSNAFSDLNSLYFYLQISILILFLIAIYRAARVSRPRVFELVTAFVFGLLLESFTLFPIGKVFLSQDLLAKMTAWGAMMFVAALLIALPVMITLLFVNIGVGFITRAAPQLNIFSVGLPAILLSGFVVMWLAVPSMVNRISWWWVQTFAQMRGMLMGG